MFNPNYYVIFSRGSLLNLTPYWFYTYTISIARWWWHLARYEWLGLADLLMVDWFEKLSSLLFAYNHHPSWDPSGRPLRRQFKTEILSPSTTTAAENFISTAALPASGGASPTSPWCNRILKIWRSKIDIWRQSRICSYPHLYPHLL